MDKTMADIMSDHADDAEEVRDQIRDLLDEVVDKMRELEGIEYCADEAKPSTEDLDDDAQMEYDRINEARIEIERAINRLR